MKKRLVSIVLALAVLFCSVSVCAYGDTDITVYLSISRYGELVRSEDEEFMAYVPVVLNGDENYNLDDVFKKAHRLYYPLGEDGYASSEGDWGLGIDMLWGDTSGNFGYQVNAGQENVMGLTHPVEDGDYIDVCIYRNLYPDTESYSRFDIQRGEVFCGQEISLALSYASGYDDYWNAIYSPCDGASVFVNGNEAEYITDENGEVTLSFSKPGTYIITASKTKTLKDEIVPAITAAVCMVEVKDPATEIMHNIAAMYSQSDFVEAGGNLSWILADMCVYEELFPYSENILTEERRDEGVSLIADFVSKAEKPGDLAKGILALNALGYDATRIYTEDFEYINPVEKLIFLADSNDEAVTNIYTLPYVVIALWEADYDGMDKLIDAALESKDAWQDVTYGTDAVTPMILALSPYSDDELVMATIEESVEIVKNEQREDGLIDGFEGYEAASTGLAVCGLASVGVDPSQTICGEKSLIDGLISVANEDYNGFPNAFATEQGFRGLLAWSLMDDNRAMYDFSYLSKEELNLSDVELCPVIFDVSPKKAKITIEGYEEIREGLFDLPAGEYTYKVTCSGYKSEEDTFTVGEDDVLYRKAKTIDVSLSKKSYDGGLGGGSIDTTDKITEPKEEEITTPKQEEKKKVSEVFSDIPADAWYNSAVQYVYEKGLFGGTGDKFEPDTAMTRAMLVTVLFRLEQPETTWDKVSFADVKDDMWYTQSVAWAEANGIVTGVSKTEFMPDSYVIREQIAVVLYRYACLKEKTETLGDIESFADALEITEFAKEAMEYAVGTGIINGKDNNMLCPKENANRAEVATMLMRFAEVMAK